MDQNNATSRGLRPTRRQWCIFGAYTSTVVAVASFARVVEARGGGWTIVPAALLLSPWLLGILIIAFDRPGPLRNWMGPVLLSLFYPGVALWYDVASLAEWVRFGQYPAWAFAVFLNVVFLGGFTAYIVSMGPRRCPRCSRRALIPLLRLGKQEQRTAKTRWCAACGAQLWRDLEGQWRPERRKTWLDAARERGDVAADPGPPPAPSTPHCLEEARVADRVKSEG